MHAAADHPPSSLPDCGPQALAALLRELRLPLAAIEGFGDVLAETSLQAPQRTAVAAMQDNVQHLLDLVADYHDLVLLAQGTLRRTPARVEPCALLGELVRHCQRRCAQSGVELEPQWLSFLPSAVQLDQRLLARALGSLLAHVLQSGPPSLRLALAFHPHRPPLGRLLLRFEAPPGRGRAPARRFATSLTLVRALAALHDGDLVCERDLRGNGTWLLRLLVSCEPGHTFVDPLQAAPAPAPPPLRGRVLVAADGRDSRVLLAHALQRAGAEPELCDRGDLAVQAALGAWRSGRPFAAMLADAAMPVLDGREVVRVLRREGYGGRIVCLGDARDLAAHAECLAAGADAWLGKPVPPAVLVDTVAALL